MSGNSKGKSSVRMQIKKLKLFFQDKRKTQTAQNILGLMGPGKLRLRIGVYEGTGLISKIPAETIYCTFIE